MMVSNEDVDDSLKPSFYLLVGFCLELGLKSLCLSSGLDNTAVKRLNHDLDAALLAATDAGQLAPVYTDLHLLVETISPMHKALWFRYTPANVPVLHVPPPPRCIGPLLYLTKLADAAAWAEA